MYLLIGEDFVIKNKTYFLTIAKLGLRVSPPSTWMFIDLSFKCLHFTTGSVCIYSEREGGRRPVNCQDPTPIKS